MKIRWVLLILSLFCVVAGVYCLIPHSKPRVQNPQQVPVSKNTSEHSSDKNIVDPFLVNQKENRISTQNNEEKKNENQSSSDKQETIVSPNQLDLPKNKDFVNNSFLPELNEDWLIAKQKEYNQERSEAIAVAQARSMPIDGPNLFLRGIQDNRLLYYQTENANAAISTGANLVRNTAPYNVNGSGLTIGVWDAGSVMPTHQEFDSRVIAKDGASPHYHSTHVGGTIGGNGTNINALGMAPSVLIDSYDWNSDVTEMGSRGARYPGDANRIQCSNHSYGVISGWSYTSFSGNLAWHWLSNISTLTESFFGQYNSEAADLDEISQNDPYYLIVKSAGNDRSDGPSNGNTVFYWNGSSWTSVSYNNTIHPKGDGVYKNGYDTIPTAGNAKNILTIGAVHDAVTSGARDISKATMSTFSGWGPTDDGRIKPDVVGNGINLTSADSASTTSYAILSGTSMAGPNVAGSIVLIQDFFDNKFPGHMLRASSLKCLVIATADDIGTSGPDYSNGWGLVNVKKAIDLVNDYFTNPGNRLIVEGKLISSTNTSDQYIYESDGLSPLIATIVWTDPKGFPTNSTDSTTSRLVNNLNLKVIAPDGTTNFYPFVLNSASPSNAATTGVNNLDPVEQVRIASPVAGLYTVQIDFSGSLSGGSQYYSLVMQGVKKNVSVGLPMPVTYSLGATSGSIQEIQINGSNFLIGANVVLLKTGFSNVVATNLQVTPEGIKGYIPSNTISTLDWEVRVTNPDSQVGSNLPKPTSMISNLISNTILTGNSITLNGTSSSLGEPITSVKIVIDNSIEYSAVNTGTNFSTWSYNWNLITEAGTISHSVKTIAYTANFQEQTPIVLNNITIDNIAPGVLISSSTYTTTEMGGSATVSVKLQKKPSNDVVISFSSSNTNEATLSKNSLTFTSLNWFTPQTFNVIGVNEYIDDDDMPYTIVINPLTSSDLAYHLMDPADLNFTNIDNDTAGVIVTGANLIVTEALLTTQFQVRLATEPTANVTVNISSSDISEGTISTSTIIFTPLNWMNDVSLTVLGVDDVIADGDIDFYINFPSQTTIDTKYNALSVASINAKCLDNENVGLNISTSSPFTYEGATSAVLTFTLMSQPTANVTYPITTNGTSQVSLSSTSLTFTSSNWNQPKTITVSAINDFKAENDFNLNLNFGPTITSSLHYQNNARNYSLTVKDNDIVGVSVSAVSGNINENGETAYFNMSLLSQPNQDVTISLITSNTSEATLSVSSYTFTANNWNILKKITIIPIDDSNFDGDIAFTINGTISTSDSDYQFAIFPSVNVTSIDDEIPSILVTANSTTVSEGGGFATASIKLKLAPSADVSVPISSSDLTEGSVSPAYIVFTTTNWSSPQTITITGIDDSLEDGNVNFNLITGIATSADASYQGLSGPVRVFTNVDNDDLTPPITSLNGTAEMNLRLGNTFLDPLAFSIDAKEGFISNIIVSGSVNNNLIGDYTLSYYAMDSKGNISNTVTRKVTVQNTAGINFVSKDYLIKENGGSDTLSISLKDAPNSNVVLELSILGAGVSIQPSSFTFNSSNWNQNQTVMITSIDDHKVSEITGKLKIEVNKPLSESNYHVVEPVFLNYTLIEDDENGFDVSIKALSLAENQGQGEIAVSLRSQPNNDVYINFLNPAPEKFNIEPSQISFNSLNWNVSQKFKCTSIDNNSPSPNLNITSQVEIGSNSDPAYLLLDVSQRVKEIILVSNNEDVAGFYINNKKLLIGPYLADSFKVKLTAQPKDKVIVVLESKNAELSFSSHQLEFDALTWSIEQEITVSGTSSSNMNAEINLNIDSASDTDFLSVSQQSVSVNLIASEEDLVAITVESNEGGQVSPSGKFVVIKNESINFDIKPLEGFELEKILIDGQEASAKRQFSLSATKDMILKIFFVKSKLLPTPETTKPLPSSEQLSDFNQLKSSIDNMDGLENNLATILELSRLKLTDADKSELLQVLNTLTENSLNISDISVPILALLNLKESSETEVGFTAMISIAKNLLGRPDLSSEQSKQLFSVIDSGLKNSTANVVSTNKESLISILEILTHIEITGLKDSSSIKNEILFNKLKLILQKVDLTSQTDQTYSQDTGASEIYLPASLVKNLQSQGHSQVFFKEMYSPMGSQIYFDLKSVPVSDITTIEILDANFNKIDINNLSDSIQIKIPISQVMINELKVNEILSPMFYNSKTNQWSSKGIVLIEQNSEFIVFQVNHLTDFALFKINNTDSETVDSSPIDDPITLNPTATTGGGGCTYLKNRPIQGHDIAILILLIMFYAYRKKIITIFVRDLNK